MSTAKDDSGKFLRCLAYSPCGNYLYGAAKSRHLLIFSTESRTLLRRLPLTQSLDLDNVRPKLNSRFIKEGVNTALLSA